MLKYRIHACGIDVWLDSGDPNEPAPLQYSGDVPEFRDWLENSYGAFGHLIDTDTTPIDLDHVLNKAEAERFRPELIEGTELVQSYDPDIPDGATT